MICRLITELAVQACWLSGRNDTYDYNAYLENLIFVCHRDLTYCDADYGLLGV